MNASPISVRMVKFYYFNLNAKELCRLMSFEKMPKRIKHVFDFEFLPNALKL